MGMGHTGQLSGSSAWEVIAGCLQGGEATGSQGEGGDRRAKQKKSSVTTKKAHMI